MERWYFPLKHVAQGDSYGCAIACVAVVAGLTYERARAEMFPRRREFVNGHALRADEDQIRAALDRLGFKTSTVTNLAVNRGPVIVSFAWNPERRGGCRHAVVWDPFARRFIDPGNANGYVAHDEGEKFLDLWKRSGWRATVVTGRVSRRLPTVNLTAELV